LTQGEVKIVKDDKMLTILFKGRSFGEMSLIDNQPRSANAMAIEYCEYLSIDNEQFIALCKDHSFLATQFILKIIRLLSQRLRQTSGQLCEFLE
jgi:CRP/FNR family transcriptional regulator/CRP/FNR family cyclic AMP-dependent transcriptional regulator